jgi:hypothetical protein
LLQKNEFLLILEWQGKLIDIRPNFYFTEIQIDRIYSDRGQTIVKYNNFTYVLYYKYDIPILLNLNTGKSRCIYGSNNINHNGVRIDHKLAKIISEKFEIPYIIV